MFAEQRSAEEITKAADRNLQSEYVWLQSIQGPKTFHEVLMCLRECCKKLHLGHKCDRRLQVPITQSVSEKYGLIGKHGGDSLKATVTLLGDNVIQAEVAIKHLKAPGGVFRAVAQPDVQWKLQQIQDLGNHIAKATTILCEMEHQMKQFHESGKFDLSSGPLILSEARTVKELIASARNAILLPRKRTLLELCNFPPTRRFVPPLPQDLLLSFYISSCRLVCASYQIPPKAVNAQGLVITMAECQLTHLDERLKMDETKSERQVKLDRRYDWARICDFLKNESFEENEKSTSRAFISRLRHVENETDLERKYREDREELNRWNSDFWAAHNQLFTTSKAEFVSKRKQELGRLEQVSANDLSIFYKKFLDDRQVQLSAYNREWYRRNLSLIWPALKVNFIRFLRLLKRG
ncbi:hypothetical protein WR25_09132 [Diploscapter pachys]|uniref:Uncharacterized protein n=1 Tax=Diploscapter pachys TaxID=2018661 RepID=A0A2A2LI46_9BILA|nr:hypothetical protein WR25_09132 [Diploscapter pachys]